MTRWLLGSMAFGCWLLAARPTLANGRFPLSNQIVFSPSDPNLVIARTSYGILPSHDNGATWQFICEDALGLSQTEPLDPAIGLTEANSLVVGVTSDRRTGDTFLGLDVSTDVGCSWNCIAGPLLGQAVSDVVVRPDSPHAVLAVTSTYRPVDAGGGAYSQVFQSTDDGATWSTLGAPLDPGVIIQTIDVARSDPARIYLSGTRVAGGQKTASLFVSTDTGATWAERPLTQFDSVSEEYLWIAAVDPKDEDRVYVRTNAPINPGGKSRLYVTTDAGQSFRMVLDFQVPPALGYPNSYVIGIGELLGFALSPDGSKVYAGSKEQGLFLAAKADLAFRPVNSSVVVTCLAARGNELWACSEAQGGFIVGVSTDDGAHFCPKMRQIVNISGTISCPAHSGTTLGCGAQLAGTQCKSPFENFCQANSYIGPCEADSPDASPAECRPPKPSGCGCSTAGAGAAGGLLAFSAGLAVATKRRRARRASKLGASPPKGA